MKRVNEPGTKDDNSSDSDFDDKSRAKFRKLRNKRTKEIPSPSVAAISSSSSTISRPYYASLSNSEKQKVLKLIRTLNQDGKKLFVCCKCEKQYKFKNSACQHIYEKHIMNDPKPWKCDCGEKFKVRSVLEDHKKREHKPEELLTCDECPQRFIGDYALERHRGSHSTKTFSCEFCDAKFNQKSGMQIHVKSAHVDEDVKIFSCSFCPTKFPNNWLCASHERSHKQKEFMCEVCGQLHSLKSNLVRHVKEQHMGDKFVECEKCHATLSKSTIERHLKAHEHNKNIFCVWCDNYFNDVEHKIHVKSIQCQSNRANKSLTSVEFPEAMPIGDDDVYYDQIHIELSDPHNKDDPQFAYCKDANGKVNKCKICDKVPNAKVIYYRGVKWIIPKGLSCKSTWHLYLIVMGEENDDQERYGGQSKRSVSHRAKQHFSKWSLDGKLIKSAITNAQQTNKKIQVIPLCSVDKDPVALSFGEIQLQLDFDMLNRWTGGRNKILGGSDLQQYYECLQADETNTYIKKKIRQVQHVIPNLK